MRNAIIAMSIVISIVISIIILLPAGAVAQGGTPFLNSSPSPYSTGIGGAGVALPTDDPFKAFHNPALLGLSEYNSNLSTSFYLQPVSIFDRPNIQSSNHAINAGYDLGKISEDLPLFVGISFIRQNIDLGEFTKTNQQGTVIGKYSQQEYTNSFSIGIGYSYYVDIAVGFTYNNINSAWTTTVANESDEQADAGAYDLGILISYPVLSSYDLGNAFSTNLNISTGWSINNVGDKLKYSDKSSLLTRQARLGYGIITDLTYKLKDIPFKLLTAEWTMEANDQLIKPGLSAYESNPIGDINVIDDIISGKSHNGVVIRGGFRATIAELFSISVGPFAGNYKNSFGWTVHTNGLFKVLNVYFGGGVLDFLASHIDIRYVYSQYEFVYSSSTGKPKEYKTDLSGLELRIINVDL